MKGRTLVGYVASILVSMYLVVFTTLIYGQNNSTGSDESTFVRAYFFNENMAFSALEQFEVEALEISYEDGYIVIDADAEAIELLKALHFVVRPYPEYDIHHNRIYGMDQDGTIPGYPSYKTVEKTYAIAESLCTAVPNLATWIDAGDSWEKTQGTNGYDIMVLRLTNSKIPGPKPKLFITGSIHAREYATSELNLRFVLHLLENYGKNADATWMLDHQEVHAMFYANPDGRKHAEGGKLWRKNTNSNYCKNNTNKRGCDLNRNFDYKWSSSSDECGETYSGTSGGSEPETKAVQNYLDKEFKNSEHGIYIDLHSYGKIIMNPNTNEHEILAKKFSYYNKYKARKSTRGMTYQYSFYKTGVISFLFELGNTFFEKCDYFEKTIVPDNIKAFEYAFKACRSPKTIPSGPEVLAVTLDDKKLTATIDDSRVSSGSTQTISAAEYYIGTPPWVQGATAIAMTAVDGKFDAKVEKVTAILKNSDLRQEKTTIFVRGKDADNNWGSIGAVFSDQTGINFTQTEVNTAKVMLHHTNPSVIPVTITITLPKSVNMQLSIYNVKGSELVTLVNEQMAKGEHVISWNGKNRGNENASAGIYFFRLKMESSTQITRFVFAR